MMKRFGAMVLVLVICRFASAADDSEVFQTLCKLAFMGQRAEAELNTVSTNATASEEIRAAARTTIQYHDRSGTNSFEALTLFIRGWTITNEPPLNANTIGLMKRSMELGHSAAKQLDTFATDTNRPVAFRDAAARFLAGLRENDRKTSNQASEAIGAPGAPQPQR
jgi:hypothetical protein